jgi:hypothetical protein
MNVPVASGAAVFFCPDPNCQHPHLLLFDEYDNPMAHFVVDQDFFQKLAGAMNRRQQ